MKIVCFLLFCCTFLEAKEVHILCLGDSLTEGFGLAKSQAYPHILEDTFKSDGQPHVKVINAGVSGATTASGLGRLRWALRAKHKPSILLLALGANDGLRGQDVSNSKENLRKVIQMAKAQNLKVVLAGMKMPPNYGKAYTERYEAMFPALAKEENIHLIPFLLEGVAAKPSMNLPDRIHPNAKGQKQMAATIYPHLQEVIASLP